ncbi:ubiquitin homeostasis protein lub1 [Patellaria atrata CBS 101060]|uniref:Ubiquitin homeostasis protein lub1 n=1 Tax=Patellaria atrata CBS 101060 TaxID=1346257 RepID=A0A9P4S2H5_9PEZI|nr:ubiquitin homeostasis protein lub1 [Patellaria atrata CBS 101060]
MGDFKLSASLQGHEDDVRGVSFPDPKVVLSASRDATVRLWKLLSSSPPTYDCTLSSHGSAFINAVAYVPSSDKFPDGLIVSGGKDTIIEVRQPGRQPSENADALLLGHAANVCALDVSADGRTIVSGGWDAEARIWTVGQWEGSIVLQGHEGSVWAVLAYDRETIITGCADRQIRMFHPSGKLVRSIRGGPDVVRALCKLPHKHPSTANFASAGNDAVIRLWTIQGKEVGQLHGHENFIYSLGVLTTGEIVSSSEDRTARIWNNNQCIQTITHPAISVWSISVCAENGDIATGASDRIVRVFSRSPDRQADPPTIQAFEDSVKASSIPQQAVGNINKEQLPGPDFIQRKSGTKDGQVQMIQETNGNVSAYQWSSSSQTWINVGTVVDAVGSSGRKISYQGQDYDYVFDVDIEDGKPALKLPFNLSQNVWDVARKFIADNELPITYLDQVANFITTNTQGASLGPSSSQQQVPGSDPWGTGSRYRPGEVDAPSSQQKEASAPKLLPQTSFLEITSANLPVIEKKIRELNSQLLEQGRKDISLNPSDLDDLAATIKQLQQSRPGNPSTGITSGIDIAIRIATTWPVEKRIPGLDLLRLFAAATPNLYTRTSSDDKTIVDLLASAGVFEPQAPPNHTMLAIRALVNLFNTDEGRLIADGEFDKIYALVEPFAKAESPNKNSIIAIATLFINYAVLMKGPTENADRALTLLDALTGIVNSTKDLEALYRALVGAGTLLSLGEDFREAAREAFDFERALERAESVSQEARVKSVVREMRDMLGKR